MSQKKNCIELVESILTKIHDLPRGPFWVRDVVREQRYPFPVMLNVGDGRHIYINPEIDRMIGSLSKAIMREFFRSQVSNFTSSEWIKMAKAEFGSVLVNSDDEVIVDRDSGEVLKSLVEKLDGRINDIPGREYVFGCHFCNVSRLESFSIGPVRFEPRHSWLQRVYDSGNISKTSFSRITRAWRGERLRKRKASKDEIRESELLDTIGSCEFVCSVTVGPVGAEAGLQKAATAARLATTAVAIAWERPSSVLDVMTLTFDQEPYRRRNLVFFPNGGFGYRTSWSHLSGGVTWMPEQEWVDLLAEFDTIFNCVGEVITYVTHGYDAVSRPELLNVLFQALLWFHEGCREQVDAMAIVKHCATMEALACGRRKRGILNLVRSRLIIRDETKFEKDLERIYGDGRSRTVHGTNDKLGQDWSADRQLAEGLARLCLVSCLERVSECPRLEDPERLSEPRQRTA